MTVRLVHGIRQFKPGGHMSALERALHARCVATSHVNYGPVWLPITNQRAVNAVLEAVQPYDDVVAYSNGAWAAHQAVELGCPIRHLYLISPALNVQAEFPTVTSVTVYHSQGDNAVLAGRWYRKLTRLLPWRWCKPHGWGAMGRFGYSGRDIKVVNIEMPHHVGHSWHRHDDIVQSIAERVVTNHREITT